MKWSWLGEFYCVSFDNDFDFSLRRKCTVETTRSSFPTTDSHIHKANVHDGED